MKRKISPTKLGLFVLCGVVIVVGALLWIGAAHILEKTKTYVTFFDQSVQGLNAGSDVNRLGVKIGRVSSISLVQNGRLVMVEIKIGSNIRISKNEAAEKQSAGLTGGDFLAIINAPADVRKITPRIDFPTRYPVIPSVPGGGLSGIENSIQGITKKLQDLNLGDFIATWEAVGQNANKIVSNKGIDETIENLKQTSITLNRFANSIVTAENITNIDSGIKSFSAAAESARKTSSSINRQVEAIPPNSFAQLIERVDRAAKQTEQATASLNNQMTDVLARFEQSANQFARVLSDLDALVRSLKEEPGRIFKEPKGKEPFEK